MSLNCFYVLSILGKHSLILKEKRVFVLNFTETRDKLFFILGISEARVLKKVVLKKTRSLKAKSKYSVILIYAVTSLFSRFVSIKSEVTKSIDEILPNSCSAGPN